MSLDDQLSELLSFYRPQIAHQDEEFIIVTHFGFLKKGFLVQIQDDDEVRRSFFILIVIFLE
jgi:hypothetical protein